MTTRVLPVLAGLWGCAPCVGSLEPEGGEPTVPASGSLSLTFVWRGEPTYGGEAPCGGVWTVAGIDGGDATVGTVDDCGLYTAPAVPPSAPVTVMAAEFPVGQCADCCPHGSLELTVTP